MFDSTVKSFIQDNMIKVIAKVENCDPTVAYDIAAVSSALAIGNYTKSISGADSTDFSNKFREYIDLFPKKCSCSETKG